MKKGEFYLRSLTADSALLIFMIQLIIMSFLSRPYIQKRKKHLMREITSEIFQIKTKQTILTHKSSMFCPCTSRHACEYERSLWALPLVSLMDIHSFHALRSNIHLAPFMTSFLYLVTLMRQLKNRSILRIASAHHVIR